jgi:hypothetical protein
MAEPNNYYQPPFFSWNPDFGYKPSKTGPRYEQPNHINCSLKCIQCEGGRKDKKQCTRKVCIGLPVCWQHARSEYHVRVKNGVHGKGLFAEKAFEEGDFIVPYFGEVINAAEFERRFGYDDKAIYTTYLKKDEKNPENDRFESGECQRGLGSIINHSDSPNAGIGTKGKTRRAYIFALKDIEAGKEILLNYGDEYTFNSHDYQTIRRPRGDIEYLHDSESESEIDAPEPGQMYYEDLEFSDIEFSNDDEIPFAPEPLSDEEIPHEEGHPFYMKPVNKNSNKSPDEFNDEFDLAVGTHRYVDLTRPPSPIITGIGNGIGNFSRTHTGIEDRVTGSTYNPYFSPLSRTTLRKKQRKI